MTEIVKEKLSVDKRSYNISKKWWSNDEESLSTAIFADCRSLQNNYSYFYRNAVLNEAVYNANPTGWNTGFYNTVQWTDNFKLNRNCAGSIVDTLASKICKNIPTVEYITKDGDWHLQNTAKDLSLFIQGHFQHENVNEISSRAFVEGTKQGTSGMLCRMNDGNVNYELVTVQQIRCSIDAAMRDRPESMHFIFLRNRYDLAKKYPDKAEDIMRAGCQYDFLLIDRMSRVDEDLVVMIESYSTFANRRVVCVDGAVLEDEDWQLKDGNGDTIFPVAWFNYRPGIRNLFSRGLIQDIRTLQWEMDKILRTLAKATHLVVVPKMLVHTSANIKQSDINNEIARINWQGEIPPSPFQMGQIPRDYYEQLNMYCEMMFQISGLSELTASSQKPAGLDSGEALKTYYNIESDRFQMTGQAYERMYISLNDITLRMLNQFPTSKNTVSLYFGKNFKKQIHFKDVDIDRDQIRLQSFVIDSGSLTPDGQLRYAQAVMQMGLADRTTALKLLDMPDMTEYTDLQTSEYDFCLSQMRQIAEGEDIYPDINQDLDLALAVAKTCYFDFINKGLDEDRLTSVRNYMIQLQVINVQKNAQQQLYMQAALQQQQMQMQAQSGTNPSQGTNSGYAVSRDPTNNQLRAAAGMATPVSS